VGIAHTESLLDGRVPIDLIWNGKEHRQECLFYPKSESAGLKPGATTWPKNENASRMARRSSEQEEYSTALALIEGKSN